MHDPMVVAFEIRRPWPKRRSGRSKHRYWPVVITVWHVEPDGRDAGEVCAARRRRWHINHWRIQVIPLQRLRRRLLTRCEECGRKGRPNVSHQWDRERGPWWRGERGLYHHGCSELITRRRQGGYDEALIRALAAECRVRSDESHDELVERLYNGRSMDFHLRHRLKNMLEATKDTA